MKLRAVLMALAAAGLLGACGGGSSGGSSGAPPATSPVTTEPSTASTVTAPPTTVTKTASTHPASQACTTGQLSLSLGASQGAAGTFYQPVILTNTSSTDCSLFGYPGVSFADTAGNQVGVPAGHDPDRARVVRLAAGGGKASSLLRQPDPGNYPSSKCHSTHVSQLKVFPPNQRVPLLVADSQQVCTTTAARAGIGVMQAGTDPH